MKYINVINSIANLDILKTIKNSYDKIELEYKGVFSPCVVAEEDDGTVILVMKTLEEYNKYDPNKPLTDITVSLGADYMMVGVQSSFSFTSGLPDKQHFMPIRQQGTDVVKLFVTDVLDGAGTLDVTFAQSGIYYIDSENDDLVTAIAVNGDRQGRFTVYVGE